MAENEQEKIDFLIRRTIGVLGQARKNLVFFAQERNEAVISIDALLPALHAAIAKATASS